MVVDREQVAAERALGLQPAPFMEAKDQSIQCHMEASFIQTVARPLWEGLAIVLPALGPAVKRMAVNSDIYLALAQLAPHKISKACPAEHAVFVHAWSCRCGWPAHVPRVFMSNVQLVTSPYLTGRAWLPVPCSGKLLFRSRV